MPAPQTGYYAFSSTSVPVPGIVETVIATSRSVSSSYAGCTFAIMFDGQFTAGADQTSVLLRIRRGTLTGTAIYTSGALTKVAASITGIRACTTDQIAGEVASQVYVLTATQAGGVADGAAANMFSEVVVAL